MRVRDSHTAGQTDSLRPGLVTSEKLQSPIHKCTFPGDKSEAAEVLTANGSTHSAQRLCTAWSEIKELEGNGSLHAALTDGQI